MTTSSEARRDLIVIGGSAGALEALQSVVKDLPPRLPAAVCVVIHTPPRSAQLMVSILERSGRLPAAYARDGDELVRGRIYVAAPDHHLLVEPGVMRLTRGPKENGFRPAVDPLFRTAARAYGTKVVGVILSGGNDDGTLGLAAIAHAGGVTIVQNPDDARVPSMPLSAIEHSHVDHVLDADRISPLLTRLMNGSRKKPVVGRGRRKVPLKVVGRRSKPDPAEAGTDLAVGSADIQGPPSIFICPECGGPLWESNENGLLCYRCHVGHAFGYESLLGSQADALDRALWTALRSLEESAALRRRMSSHARAHSMVELANRFDEEGDDFEQRAATVRKVLVVENLKQHDDRLAEAVARRARRASKP